MVKYDVSSRSTAAVKLGTDLSIAFSIAGELCVTWAEDIDVPADVDMARRGPFAFCLKMDPVSVDLISKQEMSGLGRMCLIEVKFGGLGAQLATMRSNSPKPGLVAFLSSERCL